MIDPSNPTKQAECTSLPQQGGSPAIAHQDRTSVNGANKTPLPPPLPASFRGGPLPKPPTETSSPAPASTSEVTVPPILPAPPPYLAPRPPGSPPTAAAGNGFAAAPSVPTLHGQTLKEIPGMGIVSPPKPSVKMTKTQPLMTLPTPAAPPPVPLTIAKREKAAVIDSIPLPLCWALVVVSAATLIIEIWTYIS